MKKIILLLLPIMIIANLSFIQIKADEAVTLYVNENGSDVNDGLTEDKPLATLAKAAEIVNSDHDNTEYVIYVTSDLTMDASARFYDHNVTIEGKNDVIPVVKRADSFMTNADTARSWYNPAMLEIQTVSSQASLTLKNIIFDDNFKHSGTVFAQAISGEGREDNTIYVQDAIVASNATNKCMIVLDEGAILRNFGGMSAIRATGAAEIVMKDGSVIEDTETFVRQKSNPKDKNEVGAAGAIWLQGGFLITEEGSKIQNINGRAIYVDSGNVELAGEIVDIVTNKDGMWFADSGVVMHLRNGAVATLKSTSMMDNHSISGSGTAIVVNDSCILTAEYGSVIKNYKMTGITVSGQATVDFDGEITGLEVSGGQAFNIQRDGFDVTLRENSNIHHNKTWYGTLYIQGNGVVNLYGKIVDNIGTDRAGGVAMAHNLNASTVNMYDGAEISRNYSPKTGGGLMISKGTFNMYGGTIADNIAGNEGGGIYVRNGGMFIMNGGTIENNVTAKFGGAVAYESATWGGVEPFVEINDGNIFANMMNVEISKDNDGNIVVNKENGLSNDIAISNKGNFAYNDRCLKINDSDVLGNKDIYFVTDDKTVTAVGNSEKSIWLGNAHLPIVTQLENASQQKGWSKNIASFYVNRGEQSIQLKVGNIDFDDQLPVFAVVLSGVSKDGKTNESSDIEFYNTEISGNDIYVTLPADNTDELLGREVILVQPTKDIGSVVIEGPQKVQYNGTLSEYHIAYTQTFVMSQNMAETIKQYADSSDDSNFKCIFTVEADSKLTAQFVEFTSSIFDINDVKVEGNKLTLTCKLKADWKQHLDELTTSPMELNLNGILLADDFVEGDILNTTGQVSIDTNFGDYYLPANVVDTLEVNQTGSLMISKTVKGIETDEMFKVKITLDETINGIYGDVEFKDGIAYIELADGYEFIIDNLPIGTNYKVEEVEYDKDKYVVSYENNEGIVSEDEMIEVNIFNTYSVHTPETGDTSHIYLWVAVMAVSAAAIICLFVMKKNKKM